ncbi:hypothetical protein AAMO2058_000836300 [Amorphochlora amoebiformis]
MATLFLASLILPSAFAQTRSTPLHTHHGIHRTTSKIGVPISMRLRSQKPHGGLVTCARRDGSPNTYGVSRRQAAFSALILSLASLPAPSRAEEGVELAAPGEEERPMTAVERLRAKQKAALQAAEIQAKKIEYEDGSVTLVYPISALEDLRTKDPVVRQRLAAPGRGSLPRKGFPYFVRDGYTMKMFIEDDYTSTPEGLSYKVLATGKGGPSPKDGQKVIFDFTAYNENGDQIDSSLRKAEPPSAKIGLGTIVPGVELALKQMSIGDRWRIIVSPNLGPPTGPSTFFSAKQFQTFDIELKEVKTCTEKKALFVTAEDCAE